MKKLIILLLLTSVTTTQAQNFNFGKVSKEELEETQHPLEPEANAAVLYKSENVFFMFSKQEGFTQVREVSKRIKIYNKEGYDYATEKLRFYNENSSSRENISRLNGYTYTLKNGSVEKIKLKKESIFENEINKYWATKSFTMPGVEEGCIIEYEYTIKTPFMNINDLIIQYDIPVNKIEVKVTIPEYFNYNKVSNLRAKIQPVIEEDTKRRKETINSVSRGESLVGNSSFNSSSLDFIENIYKINMDNIPSLKEEPLVDNMENYRSKLALEYAYFKSPDGVIKPYSTTWDKITEKINKSESFGDQLAIKNYFKDDLSNILKEAKSDSEKIIAIFEHVKSKVKWNSFIGYNTHDGVKKAYKDGVGNVAEINLILISMLKEAGINAHPVLLSTRDNGVPLFPTRDGFNYVICAIEDSNNLIYLDATQQHANPNILPARAINWLGRIVRDDDTSDWVQLSPKAMSKEIISLSYNLNEDLTETGKLRKRLTNYLAYNFRNKNAKRNKDEFIQNIESDNSGLTIKELNLTDAENYYKPVTYDYEFDFDGAAEEIADKIYVSPLALLSSEENPFIQDTRNYPIDFITPISSKYIVNISIPEGYEVEFLPEATSVKFNVEGASFNYFIKQAGKNIQIIVDTEIKQTLILSKEYQDFKKFYQLLKDKEAEKIVLKKV